MNHAPGEIVRAVVATAVPPAPRRTTLGAIFTDMHFWIPVAVLALGLSLLGFLS